VIRWTFRIIDVFTSVPLAGNQLAVFEDATGIPEALLQPLAREINYSESVFLYPAEGEGDARIRIFTPSNEVPFAGHPVLGAAVLVAIERGKDGVVLETGRGDVPVVIERAAGAAVRGTMEQPIPAIAPYIDPAPLLAALGVERSLLPVTFYDIGILHVFVTLGHPDEVAVLAPDAAALTRLARDLGTATVGFNVFAGEGTAWKTRMFSPGDGIAEDPATGSAAGPLALHLARHGVVPWGTELEISQGAEIGRPSTLFATVSGSEDVVTRIVVSGFAVPVGGGWFDSTVLG
jgi:trans-2,3-dihydro-3-hydroxyanthranilate isomerase